MERTDVGYIRIKVLADGRQVDQRSEVALELVWKSGEKEGLGTS